MTLGISSVSPVGWRATEVGEQITQKIGSKAPSYRYAVRLGLRKLQEGFNAMVILSGRVVNRSVQASGL